MIRFTIDGETADRRENSLWRGFGFISANNSSRLLLDYRRLHPDAYQRLMRSLFDPDGALRLSHIKLEMGADINSSSGTEPSVKRSADEPADVTRGAGFIIAADAVRINPDITLELLSWAVPGYIKNAPAEEQFSLRYLWFKETLDAAYRRFGLAFSYIDPNINERAVEKEWLKYFSARLKAEKDTPYPYKDIKIVAADEEACFNVAGDMLRDKELMAAVDVIGVHYISRSSDETKRCKEEFGKELWYSEGLAPANVPRLAARADGSGLMGVNGLLDVAGRIVNMYPCGGYTHYEFQPAVAAYYSGACYYPKQLIRANEPWSGHIEYCAGVYMAEHFARFSRKGWQFVRSACFGDGVEREHVLYETTDNRLVLCDPETGDYTAVFVNNSPALRQYEIEVRGLEKAGSSVRLFLTAGPGGGAYDENYMKPLGELSPEKQGDSFVLRIDIPAYSILTATTLDEEPVYFSDEGRDEVMELPYSDSFTLSDDSFAPHFTTDQGGAFELVPDDERGNVLSQRITPGTEGSCWGYTPPPVTSLGDDRWANYSVSADVRLQEGAGDGNYAGIGLRYINSSADRSMSGYRAELTQTGEFRLWHMSRLLAEGDIPGLRAGEWHRLTLTADKDILTLDIDGEQAAQVKLTGAVTFSGRAAFYSALFQNSFGALRIEPCGEPYIRRLDALDEEISFGGSWKHSTMASFKLHNRTVSEGKEGSSFSLTLRGGSLALIGKAHGAVISVSSDGRLVADRVAVANDTERAAFWHSYDLGEGRHEVKVMIHSGIIELDAVEVNDSGNGTV